MARVLRVITRLNVGGPAKQALLLTRSLTDHDTLLAAGKVPHGEIELADEGMQVQRVPLVRPVHPVADARAFAHLRRLVRGFGPHIVHTHMSKAGTIGRVAALTSPRRTVLVHTFHGHVLRGYFNRGGERVVLAIERRLAARTDALIAVSPEVRDSLLDFGIGRPSQFHVIPLGFDLAPFLSQDGRSNRLRNELRLGPQEPLVGVVGRLAPIKDHSTLLRAIAQLPGVHLAVVGDGELGTKLRAEARARQLSERVHFLGWRTDVAELISDMDVVALSSRNEGSPVSLIEAGAVGRPVVATDVGGVRSVVDDGRSGFLVAPGDTAGFVDRLRLLFENPGLRARLGARGRERVQRAFDRDRLVSDIRELYRSLLHSPIAMSNR